MGRPLLGIVACTRNHEDETIHRVIDRYLRAPAQTMAVDVVLIPALGALADSRNLAARIDGLLLTGSTSNLESWRYGGAGDHGPFDPARDATSLMLAQAMLDAGKPVFGICRGFQELNVLFGGTLQHLPPARQALHHAPAGVSIPAMFAHGHTVTPVRHAGDWPCGASPRPRRTGRGVFGASRPRASAGRAMAPRMGRRAQPAIALVL